MKPLPFGIAKAERCIFALPRIAAKAAPTNAARWPHAPALSPFTCRSSSPLPRTTPGGAEALC